MHARFLREPLRTVSGLGGADALGRGEVIILQRDYKVEKNLEIFFELR